MQNKKISILINLYHYAMNVLHKYRYVMVVIWITALVTLGVVQYCVEQRIETEGSESRGSSDSRSLR